MVVVDLGCYDHEGQWPSLPVLADWYKPEIIYGFDPDPMLKLVRKVNGVQVKLQRKAAWIYDGKITYQRGLVHGRTGTIGVGPENPENKYIGGRMGMIGIGNTRIPCFDFSAWMKEHGPAVVKMDIEGSEYGLLHKMRDDGTLPLISTLLIEWHFYEDKEIVKALKQAGSEVKRWLY